MSQTFPSPLERLHVTPWHSTIDADGHDPRSGYVERYWLGVLGPSGIWLLRRLAAELDDRPDGVTLDVPELGRSLGLGAGTGRNSATSRTAVRLCQFGAARCDGGQDGVGLLALRHRLPSLSASQLSRLPDGLRLEHDRRWATHQGRPPIAPAGPRARRLALAMVEFGDSYDVTERSLQRLDLAPDVASAATAWAWEQRDTEQPYPDHERAAS